MRSLAAAVALVLALPLYAVAPQFWSVDTPEDFLAGEIEGLVVTARGSLRAGPAMTRVATVDDPFVLSQAIADDGSRFIGTGNAGKVYRLSGNELKLLYTAPEPEIYAMAFTRGALYVASSPNGKIYRVDPRSGSATEHFDPKESFIWALTVLPDGGLAAATGIEGRLYRIDANGKGKVWYDAPETHLRSIAVARNGKLLVGGSGEGRIYEVNDQGGRALYDSPLSEISTIYFDSRTGEAWAAAVTNVLPSTAPARTETKAATTASPGTQQQGSNEKDQQQQESTTAEVSFSFGDTTAASTAAAGSAELYRISADGYVDPVRKFEREMIYAITGAADGTLYVATGPLGRVYQYSGGEFALIAAVPEKQLLSFGGDGTGSAIYATTTNSGAVYRIASSSGGKGEFRSAVKDTGRFSSFGQFRSVGSNLSRGATISFRSGNTNTPDETWSAWSAPVPAESGKVSAPAARYLQMKINGAGETSVDSVSVAFVNRNVAPQIDTVSVADPAVVFLAGNYPVSPQVVEATNPDEYGIFTSLDEAMDRSTPGKRYYRRGYRTVSWKASDANGDLLRYSIYFRRAGTEPWLRLRENVDDTQLNFDTSQLPDGHYEIRVTVTDVRSNPSGALTDEREGIEMLVDNTAPKITSAVNGDHIVVRVSDALSPIGKVEYSVDAQKWVPLIADDGISDAPEESFRISRATAAGQFVVVRAVDTFYNVATAATP